MQPPRLHRRLHGHLPDVPAGVQHRRLDRLLREPGEVRARPRLHDLRRPVHGAALCALPGEGSHFDDKKINYNNRKRKIN